MLAVRHASNILQSDFMLHRNLQLNQLEDKWNTLFHELALNLLLHLIQLTLSASGRTWQCLMLAPRSTWGSQWHVLGEYTKNINSAWKLFCPNYCQDQPPLSHPPQILILLFGAKYKISNIELNDAKDQEFHQSAMSWEQIPHETFQKLAIYCYIFRIHAILCFCT